MTTLSYWVLMIIIEIRYISDTCDERLEWYYALREYCSAVFDSICPLMLNKHFPLHLTSSIHPPDAALKQGSHFFFFLWSKIYVQLDVFVLF